LNKIQTPLTSKQSTKTTTTTIVTNNHNHMDISEMLKLTYVQEDDFDSTINLSTCPNNDESLFYNEDDDYKEQKLQSPSYYTNKKQDDDNINELTLRLHQQDTLITQMTNDLSHLKYIESKYEELERDYEIEKENNYKLKEGFFFYFFFFSFFLLFLFYIFNFYIKELETMTHPSFIELETQLQKKFFQVTFYKTRKIYLFPLFYFKNSQQQQKEYYKLKEEYNVKLNNEMEKYQVIYLNSISFFCVFKYYNCVL
jgi:hypothetical protein